MRPSRTSASAAVDVLVVGAGLAGLHTATLLARRGHDVLLAERRSAVTDAIRTTGIFVRRTLDDFALPQGSLGPPIRRVVLYPPGMRRPVTLVSARDEYRVGDMAAVYVASARAAADAGVRLELGTRYAGRQGESFLLSGREGPARVRARFVVGADGARSQRGHQGGFARRCRLDGTGDRAPRRRGGGLPSRHVPGAADRRDRQPRRRRTRRPSPGCRPAYPFRRPPRKSCTSAYVPPGRGARDHSATSGATCV